MAKKVVAVFVLVIFCMIFCACTPEEEVLAPQEGASTIANESEEDAKPDTIAYPVANEDEKNTKDALINSQANTNVIAGGNDGNKGIEPVNPKTTNTNTVAKEGNENTSGQLVTPGHTANPVQHFPFTDQEGKIRYRLVINGEEVETKNWPFTYPEEPKGGFYPLKDVLSYFGVECLCSSEGDILTTKINGDILKVAANNPEMTFGRKSVNLVSKAGTPVYLNACLYVPSFLFMIIFDDGIVDFSGDRSAVTLNTKAVIDSSISGTIGLNAPNNQATTGGSSGNTSGGSGGREICGTCNGTGKSICTYCGGTGSKIEFQQTMDPISHQYKTTQKNVICPRCGGRGTVTCPSCGGTGKR